MNILYIIFFLILSLLIIIYKPTKDTNFYSSINGKVIEVKNGSYIIQCQNQNVKVYCDEELKYGDIVSMKIKQLEINEQKNDNAFNEKLYFLSHNIQIKASCEEVLSIDHKYNFVDFVESRLSRIDSIKSYQRLFILGVKDTNINDEYDQFINLSLVHLFALSGMHIYYLKKILNNLFFFIPKSYKEYIIDLLLFLYLFNIPFSLSLWRAFLTSLLSHIFKDYFNKLDNYSIVFILFLLYNPYYIYNYSFIFSFGIYLFVLLTKNMKHQNFYVYLLSIPFIIYSQNKILLISFILMLGLTKYVEILYQTIIFSLILPITYILQLEISLLQKIINISSQIDYSIILRTPNLSFIIIYYSLCFLIIMKKQLNLRTIKPYSLLISLLVAFFIYGKYPMVASVTMIDVGQGDCTLIRLPFNQGNILIDTGGNRYTDIATQTLIPYFQSIGISSIDYVYVSHDDFDHCGALESLSTHFKIKHIIKEYEEKRIIGDLKVEMLTTLKQYDNNNDNSLVMKVTLYDKVFLFTGDISSQVEYDLYKKYKHIDCDVLKVSHHGSKTATSSYLFKLIQPKIALISVKKNNIYNHPSDEVINRLNKKGVMILRTDEMGMVHLRFYNKKCYIFT
jgi:competence protein ComEC